MIQTPINSVGKRCNTETQALQLQCFSGPPVSSVSYTLYQGPVLSKGEFSFSAVVLCLLTLWIICMYVEDFVCVGSLASNGNESFK